ncbi:spexin prohormone 2-like [Ambystoma mexicanum]|uniref:spexin prohormone 2-like n=1 Tax=Ambystoma mexicanum TaxID=8296 RepID=UPI0037E71B53
MNTRHAIMYTCVVVVMALTAETWNAPKNKVLTRNWGPQSMLYLKGKYGRRYASENEEEFYKFDLADWTNYIKSYERSRPLENTNFRRRHTT